MITFISFPRRPSVVFTKMINYHPRVFILFLHSRGGNNMLMLQNSTASHRKFQDMADNVCEVKSSLVVHQNTKSTVSSLSLPVQEPCKCTSVLLRDFMKLDIGVA